MDEILLEIQSTGEELTQTLCKFEEGELTVEELDGLHQRLSGIFETIKLDGVCKQDIRELNKLGLLEVEEKYFTDVRSAVGMDVALEAEGSSGWLNLVIGAIMAAMVTVLAFFVGKFLGWLIGSTDSLSKASSSAQSKTKVKISQGADPISVDLAKVAKGKTGHLNVVALANLGDSYLKGDKIKVLLDSSTSAVDEVKSLISEYGNGGLQKALDTIVNGRDLSNRATRDEVAKELQPSNITVDLVNSTYPILSEVMGTNLNSAKSLDRDGNELPAGSIMAKSQRVSNFKGTDIFSPTLVTKTTINLLMDPNDLSSQIDDKDVTTLTNLVRGLESKFGSAVSNKGRVGGELNKRGFSDVKIGNKSTDFIVRNYINYQITYPVKYVNVVVSKVLSALLKAHVNYQSIQVKFQGQYGKIFFDGELIKLINIVEGTSLDDKAKKKLIDLIGDVRGEDIESASAIMATVIDTLVKLGEDVKSKLNTITFYKRANGNLNLRGSKLTEILLEPTGE